jgi:hypothetical protein
MAPARTTTPSAPVSSSRRASCRPSTAASVNTQLDPSGSSVSRDSATAGRAAYRHTSPALRDCAGPPTRPRAARTRATARHTSGTLPPRVGRTAARFAPPLPRCPRTSACAACAACYSTVPSGSRGRTNPKRPTDLGRPLEMQAIAWMDELNGRGEPVEISRAQACLLRITYVRPDHRQATTIPERASP